MSLPLGHPHAPSGRHASSCRHECLRMRAEVAPGWHLARRVPAAQARRCGRGPACSQGSRGWVGGGEDAEAAGRLPTQGDMVVRGPGDEPGVQVQERPAPPGDVDYLAELIAMQQNGPKDLGFFGTRNMGFLHQNLIEILSYAMDNHIYTSGATGTNAAVIRGALRAEKPHLLTVVLPQSRRRQPPESRELLEQVAEVIEMPENDDLPLLEASRMCNQDIVGRVQQVICFAFHDSRLLLETCADAKAQRKIVTLFYLD